MSTAPGTSDWRERKKAATRRTIQEHAMRLFLEKGYDATTVEEIASAAGVSHMTFFRYFPSKEEVATSDDYDPYLIELIAARPAGESLSAKVSAALIEGLASLPRAELTELHQRTQLIMNTPALRARLWDNQHTTQRRICSALVDKGIVHDEIRAAIVVSACLTVAGTVLLDWAEKRSPQELVTLTENAFAILAEEMRG